MGQSVPIILIMGIATGCFGGLLRDIVANEVPLLIRTGKLYVTAAFAGGGGLPAVGAALAVGPAVARGLHPCLFRAPRGLACCSAGRCRSTSRARRATEPPVSLT